MKQQLLITTPVIEERKGELLTTSLNVAQVFGKQHDDVLKAIKKLLSSLSDPRLGSSAESSEKFRRLNFGESSYQNEQNKKQPMYLLTEAGFTLLAMGFTGKKALEFKLAYIESFRAMQKALTQRQNTQWIEERKNGKLVRRETTDAIKDFIEYAKANGSKSADMYYMLVTKAVYKCLEMIEGNGPVPKNMRDMLDARNLRVLATAEDVARCAFIEGMNQRMFYRDIFQFAKNHVEAYAKTVMPTLKGSRLRLIKSA